jgi:hypothetical protein
MELMDAPSEEVTGKVREVCRFLLNPGLSEENPGAAEAGQRANHLDMRPFSWFILLF